MASSEALCSTANQLTEHWKNAVTLGRQLLGGQDRPQRHPASYWDALLETEKKKWEARAVEELRAFLSKIVASAEEPPEASRKQEFKNDIEKQDIDKERIASHLAEAMVARRLADYYRRTAGSLINR